MSRGGARSGAGRKPRTGQVKAVTVRIQRELYDRLPKRGKEQILNEALRRYYELSEPEL